MSEDDSQKTEEPTGRRLQDALEKGQVANSREIGNFMMLTAFTLLLLWMGPTLFLKAHMALAVFIERPDSFDMDKGALANTLLDLVHTMAYILLVPFLTFLAVALLANFGQNGIVFSFEPIIPDLSKISPMGGFKRLFSWRAAVELGKSILKIAIVGAIAYNAVAPYFPQIKQMPSKGITGILAYLLLTAKRMLIGICIVMFFIAIMDYFYQRYEYIKGLRMSKEEVKDEFKQQEGDPQIKRRLRQIRIERARRRMIAAVPTADVVVTNPTHYSIALKYDSATMRAPRLVAKGLDNMALRIREIAREHDIPLVENPPLAQALYAAVDIDREIPAEHYKAVAEVISYVYRLRGKMAQPARS